LVPYATRFFTTHPPFLSLHLHVHHFFSSCTTILIFSLSCILSLIMFASFPHLHSLYPCAPPLLFLIAALASLCTHLPIFAYGTTMFTDPTPLACLIVFLGLFYIYLLHYHFYCTHPIYSMYLSLITHALSYFIFYFYPSEIISSFIYLSFLLFFFLLIYLKKNKYF